jgi:type I restriction-modification system DNA methylase subunit
MYSVVADHVFPFLRGLGADASTYAQYMKDARFTIPTPALLTKVVDLLDAVPMDDRDTKGDLYEYMLSKIASAGQNGQFRTPRHIIQLVFLMVAIDSLLIESLQRVREGKRLEEGKSSELDATFLRERPSFKDRFL